MSDRAARRERGFSVLEALISLTLFLVLVSAVFVTYVPSRVLHARGSARVDIQQNARVGMAELARQIRMAGYFPENFTSAPPTPLLELGIRVATDSALAIYGDVDGSGASNVFLYCRDGRRLRRSRAAVNQVSAYTCSSGDVLAENVIDLEFTYYDADGNPLPSPPAAPFTLDSEGLGAVPALTTLTQRSSVRRVVVTLTAELESAQRGAQTYQLTSDVWLRNQ